MLHGYSTGGHVIFENEEDVSILKLDIKNVYFLDVGETAIRIGARAKRTAKGALVAGVEGNFVLTGLECHLRQTEC